MAEVIQFGKFITASEREVASRLKDLPANWTVICNKEVVTPAGDTYEVDFVIIGDHVIFAIDEKSWSGDIYGNENVWVLPGGEPRRSPLQKIGHVGRQLAGVLRGRIPANGPARRRVTTRLCQFSKLEPSTSQPSFRWFLSLCGFARRFPTTERRKMGWSALFALLLLCFKTTFPYAHTR